MYFLVSEDAKRSPLVYLLLQASALCAFECSAAHRAKGSALWGKPAARQGCENPFCPLCLSSAASR